MSLPSLIYYDTPSEYRQHYEKYYCREVIYTFDKIRVHFGPTKFGHVFYESTARDGKKDVFSKKRAERINWIRATLEHPDAELYQGWNKDAKTYNNDSRVSVVYENFVVVIRIKSAANGKAVTADFVTAYVADNSIDKIKKAPKWQW